MPKTILSIAASLAAIALATAAPAAGTPRYGAFGIDLTARDTSVKPGDDFWAYANGAWNKATAIAPDRTMAGVDIVLIDQAEAQVHQILDDAAAKPASVGPNARQMGDFYAAFMDQAAIERAGTAPLKPYFAQIDAASDKTKLQLLFAKPGFASPVDLGQIPNPSDPTSYVPAASQGSLGMGGRDYYLLTGEKYDKYRAAYRVFVTQMFTLAGLSDPAARADRVIALETAMAKVEWSPVQMRDMQAMLKPMDAAQRQALAPDFDWPLLLKAYGYDRFPVIIMATSTALADLGKLFAATPVSTWQDWIRFRFLKDNAAVLPKAFDDANFEFSNRVMRGQTEQRARWKRGVAAVNGALGEEVGEVYIKRYYPPESEAKMAEMIADLRAAYGERFAASPWMDEATRKAALVKLTAFDPRIGHPVKYIDYSPLKVDRTDPLGNAVRSAEFEHALDLSRLGKPVDRALWDMTPQTVNAYYMPFTNQITFPAAYLQPPEFDPNVDAAVNYGAVGATIGHEMGHGFDDEGSQFGPTGKFENWWTPAAHEAFAKRTAALVAQYDAYEPLPGLHVKGQQTLGENIGDLGGLEAAYTAFQKYQAKHGPSPVIGGLTGEQRFFLSYAQSYRDKIRDDTLRSRTLTDTHSPDMLRVNGIVRNVDAWYKAFDVKPGDKLYLPPDQRVKIW